MSRWTLSRWVPLGTPLHVRLWVQGPDFIGDQIEVMPVSEHEEAISAWVEMTREAEGQVIELTETIECHAAQCDAGASDLARLRKAAEAAVEALNFYESTLTATHRARQAPYVYRAVRDLRSVLALDSAAPSPGTGDAD